MDCGCFHGKQDSVLEKYMQIPVDVDVLITHTPPLKVLDEAWRKGAQAQDCKICGKDHYK